MLPLLSLLLLSGPAPKYPVAAIPAELRAEAHAVLRRDEELVTVQGPGRLVHTVHRVVTVLDAGGDHLGHWAVGYDALRQLSYLRGAVYDGDGRLLHQLRPAEIHDQGHGGDDGNLASDDRVRYADLRQPQVPYTVEFDYEIVSTNTLFYPTWQPQDEEGLAVELATLRVLTPAVLPLRYHERQLPAGAAGQHRILASGQQEHVWQLSALPALEEEPAAPPLTETTPIVALAASSFDVQGHRGSLASWQSLGQWNYELNAGRDELPPALAAKVAALVQDVPDPWTRARRVYELMQASTRYVSVQLGIGGWQTAPATAVSSTGYGDCKALSNYGKALLAAAGLPAYVALVRAGDDSPDVWTDFPSSQFNHVILCVPLARAGRPDTLWLECTSQTAPFGYLGGFTANRHALLLTPQGGQLVRTPSYGSTDNATHRRVDLYLDGLGNATATARTVRTGLAQDDYAGLLHQLAPSEQKKYVTERLRLPTFTLTRFSLAVLPTAARVPAVVENLGLSVPSYAPPSGKRAFLSPNLLSRLPALPPAPAGRRAPVWVGPASVSADTVRLHLPANFRPEALPEAVQLSSPFGNYSSQYQALPDGSVQYIRRLELHRQQLPATSYPAYVDFRRRIGLADKAQVVLLKTDA